MDLNASWGADVPVSLPGPVDPIDVRIGLGAGFVFTDGCLTANATAADLEEMKLPNYAPPTP